MKIPDTVHIIFKDAAGVLVKNLYCMITFYFGNHNHFLLTQITSNEGQVIMSLEQIRNGLKES